MRWSWDTNLLRIPQPLSGDFGAQAGRGAGSQRPPVYGVRKLRLLAGDGREDGVTGCRRGGARGAQASSPAPRDGKRQAGRLRSGCTAGWRCSRCWRWTAAIGNRLGARGRYNRRRQNKRRLNKRQREPAEVAPIASVPSVKAMSVGLGGDGCDANWWGQHAGAICQDPTSFGCLLGGADRRAQRRGGRHGAVFCLPGPHRQPGCAGSGVAGGRQADVQRLALPAVLYLLFERLDRPLGTHRQPRNRGDVLPAGAAGGA